MRIPEAATLITTTWIPNEYGVEKRKETSKTVYGYVNSVTGSEVFEGGRNGLNPELRFTMTDLDYDGQRIIEIDSNRYAIYRTYKPNNGTVELYCERRGGTNGS